MSHEDIDAYFARVPEWMKNDIRREIQLARVTATDDGKKVLGDLGVAGGGNVLAALGLVAYTEALGLIRIWNQTHDHGTPPVCFLAFFDAMDRGRYKTWRDRWEPKHGATLYEILRCGLVHEYRPKVDSEFWIGDGDDLGLGEAGGHLIFKVEPYYRHFSAEADRLYDQLKQMKDPQIPPPHRRAPPGVSPPSATLPPLPAAPTTSPTS